MGVFALGGFLALRGTTETSSDLMLRLTDQATERMRQYVLSTLNAPVRLGDFNADLIRDGRMPIQSSAELSSHVPFLANQMRSWSGVSAILICNNQQEAVWVERGSNDEIHLNECLEKDGGFCVQWKLDEAGLKVGEEIGRFRYEPSNRPWFKAAIESKQGYGWTPLYPWANSQIEGIVGSGRSVRVNSEDGTLLGIVDVGFTVNALSRQLEHIDISPNGRGFIMDSKGMLVAADQVHDAAAGTTGVLASETTDLEIRRAVEALGGSESFLDDRGFFHASFIWDDEIYQVDSELLKEVDAPDWRLVTILPESDILAGVDIVQERLIYSSLIVLLISAVIAILLARSITTPIVSLTRSAFGIASGDLEERFSSRGGLEFTQLSGALDRMTRGLRERLEMRTALAVAMEDRFEICLDEDAERSIATFDDLVDTVMGAMEGRPDDAS